MAKHTEGTGGKGQISTVFETFTGGAACKHCAKARKAAPAKAANHPKPLAKAAK